MSRFLHAACSVAAIFLATPAPAAPLPSTAEAVADPARMAAAARLMAAMHYDVLIDRTMDSVIKQIQNDIPAQINADLDEQLPPDVVSKLQRLVDVHIRKAINDHRAELKRATQLIYCKHFTAAELDRLAQIEADPVMIRMQAEMPEIATESMKLGQAVVADEIPKVKEEAKAVILAYLSQKQGQPAT